MINIGIIGMGGISGCHLGAYATLADNARIVACCDIIPERAAGKAKDFTINIGSGSSADLNAKAYTDYRDLLADPEVQMVDICLPTDLHAEVAIAALRAGKHVLCEKPMALKVAECDQMVAAAAAADHFLMVAHCIRFWPEYVYLKELVVNNTYGAMHHGHFTRISAPPGWVPDNWYWQQRRSGGVMLDMHIHDADYILYLLGKPSQVTTHGLENAEGLNTYGIVDYHYADGPIITAESGWDYAPNFPFRMTFRCVFDGATIEWDSARAPLTVFPKDGEPFVPALIEGDAYQREIAYFLDCIERNEAPSIVTPEAARDTIAVVIAEIESLRSHQPVTL